MFLRSLLGVVLCELVASFFFLSALSNYYVSAAAVPRSFSDPGNTIAAAREHTPWPLGVSSSGRPFTAINIISGGTLLIKALRTHGVDGAPSPAVTGLIARQNAGGDPSLPTGAAGATTATTSSTSVSPGPSFTFSDPFPPDPLPTEDLAPLPPVSPTPPTGVPVWVWGAGGAGLGVAVLFGVLRVLLTCSRKPQSK